VSVEGLLCKACGFPKRDENAVDDNTECKNGFDSTSSFKFDLELDRECAGEAYGVLKGDNENAVNKTSGSEGSRGQNKFRE
jgi:hypothetical protein